MKPLVTPRKIYGRSNFQKFVSSEVCFWKFWKIHNIFFYKICDFFVFVLQNKDNMNMGAKRPKILVYTISIYILCLSVCIQWMSKQLNRSGEGLRMIEFSNICLSQHLFFDNFFLKIRDIFLFFVNMSNLGNTGFPS